MKNFISKQKNCFLTLLGLIAISEIMLKINNMFFKVIGVMLLPFIIIFCYLLIRNDQKNMN